MSTHKHQDGFSVIEIILVVVIVGLLGLVGFVFINNHRNATNKSADTASATQGTALMDSSAAKSATGTPAPSSISSTAQASQTKSLKVPEVGIELINIPSELSDLTYVINNRGAQAGQQFAFFSTTSLTALDDSCSAANGGIGLLGKYPGAYNDDQAMEDHTDKAKEFATFWVSYGHPQSACSSNDKAEALHVSQMQAFQKLATNPANIVAL